LPGSKFETYPEWSITLFRHISFIQHSTNRYTYTRSWSNSSRGEENKKIDGISAGAEIRHLKLGVRFSRLLLFVWRFNTHFSFSTNWIT
jgi:hypothetical protein